MKKILSLVSYLALGVGALYAGRASAADLPGCQYLQPDEIARGDVAGEDIPYLPRFAGSVRTIFSKEDFGQMDFVTKFDDDYQPTAQNVEGKHWRICYQLRSNVSQLQILRNYENAFKSKGWKVVVPGGAKHANVYISAEKTDPNNHIYVVIAASEGYAAEGTGKTDIWYALNVVEVEKMKQEIEMSESGMKKALDESGRVAIYGINFDTGKSTIKPDSAQVLGEIGKLLNNNQGLKLSVEGHTDNAGDKASNQKLSEARAASVKDYLVKNFKVAPARLAAKGFGESKPVMDNSTEEGKAKNRRVELAKIK